MDTHTFWNTFLEISDTLAKEMRDGQCDHVFESLDALMASCDIMYCFDITLLDGDCLLIFSPEGDYEEAAAIDSFLADAPDIRGWRLLARRMKKPLVDVEAIIQNLYGIDLASLSFKVCNSSDEVIIDMYMHGSDKITTEEAQGMVNTFLWHALGEGFVMERHVRGRVQNGAEAPFDSIDGNALVQAASHW